MIKRILPLFLATGLLSACIPEFTPYYPTIAQQPRFDITNYSEVATADTDLTGVWMMVQSGTRNETINNIAYRTSGYTREIVQIYQETGNFYAKACVQAEASQQLVSISGDDVTVTLNGLDMTLVKSDFKNMAGAATSDTPAEFKYSGAVYLKKIAAAGTSMGSFSFYNSGLSINTLNAECFQESDLGLTGVVGIISKFALLEVFTAVDWSADGSTYSQTAYVFQKGGDVSPPTKKITFVDGVDITGPAASRAYPGDGQTFSRTHSIPADSDNFDVSFTVSGTGGFAGTTNITLP